MSEGLLDLARTYLTLHLGELNLGPAATSVLVLALAAALLSAYRLWRIKRREDRQPRLEALRGPALERNAAAQPRRPHWYDWLGGVIAASPIIGTVEQQRLLDVLAKAGIRQQGALARLFAARIGAAVVLGAVAWLLLEWRGWFAGSAIERWGVVVAAFAFGWRLPDMVLARLAARRRLHIEQGMPDALDLLVVCAEAGLSLDQSIEQVGRDLHSSHPEVAEEFATTAAEMRVLPDRGEALANLVKRTRVESLRSITATLTQAIRFGTPLAESMRVLAAEMRNARLARIEERAARLPVLLTMPLAAFILPAILIVIGTPLALRIMDFFKTLHFPGIGGVS